jgi:type I restriction enzyme R subunit
MSGPAAQFLDAGSGAPDERLDRQLYEIYFDKGRRREFFDFFKEVETLYEILSPDPALREYVGTYQQLSDLYAALRSEYESRGGVLTSDLGKKTEMLLRSADTMTGPEQVSRAVEYDAKTLASLRAKPKSDTGKVMNLLRDLRTRIEAEAATQPALTGILDRAQKVREAFEERQLSTKDALSQIQTLLDEHGKAIAERERLGMDERTFATYWTLTKAGIKDAQGLATEIGDVFDRFPNWTRNADELRQLKAEIYKVLLKEVSGKRMVEIADQILAARTV